MTLLKRLLNLFKKKIVIEEIHKIDKNSYTNKEINYIDKKTYTNNVFLSNVNLKREYDHIKKLLSGKITINIDFSDCADTIIMMSNVLVNKNM